MPEMDMRRMQEEAARRAREMQSRARQGGRARPEHPAPAPPPPPPPPEPLPPPVETPAAEQAPMAVQIPAVPAGEAPPSLLDELFKDRERTVLLALLLLLEGEEGNNELMFALLFLLM